MPLQAGRGSGFNLAGPEAPLSMGEFLQTACQAPAPAARLEWVDEDLPLGLGVAPRTELPVWLARADEALHRTPISRTLAAGPQCRPLRQTLRDAAAWVLGKPQRPGIRLAAARGAELMGAWQAR